VSLFAYDKITLKIKNVNKRRQDIDKKCLEIKKSTEYLKEITGDDFFCFLLL